MQNNILQIRKANAKKRNLASRENSLRKYDEAQAEIEQLLKQIKAGLVVHDRNSSAEPGGKHWGHVGDLNAIVSDLREINDRLQGNGRTQNLPLT